METLQEQNPIQELYGPELRVNGEKVNGKVNGKEIEGLNKTVLELVPQRSPEINKINDLKSVTMLELICNGFELERANYANLKGLNKYQRGERIKLYVLKNGSGLLDYESGYNKILGGAKGNFAWIELKTSMSNGFKNYNNGISENVKPFIGIKQFLKNMARTAYK